MTTAQLMETQEGHAVLQRIEVVFGSDNLDRTLGLIACYVETPHEWDFDFNRERRYPFESYRLPERIQLLLGDERYVREIIWRLKKYL